jgi:hypothetical protein
MPDQYHLSPSDGSPPIISLSDGDLSDAGLSEWPSAMEADAGFWETPSSAAGDVLDDGWTPESDVDGAIVAPLSELGHVEEIGFPETGQIQAWPETGQAHDWSESGQEAEWSESGQAESGLSESGQEREPSQDTVSEDSDWERTLYRDENPDDRGSGFLGSGWRDDAAQVEPRRKRRRGGVLVAAAVVILGVVVTGGWLMSGPSDTTCASGTRCVSDKQPVSSVTDPAADPATAGLTDPAPTQEPTVGSTSAPESTTPEPSSTVGDAVPSHRPTASREPTHSAQPTSKATTTGPKANEPLSGNGDPVVDKKTSTTTQTKAPVAEPTTQAAQPPAQPAQPQPSQAPSQSGGGGLLGWLFG